MEQVWPSTLSDRDSLQSWRHGSFLPRAHQKQMPLPRLLPFHILAAPPSRHHRAGCASALRTTWDNCCR